MFASMSLSRRAAGGCVAAATEPKGATNSRARAAAVRLITARGRGRSRLDQPAVGIGAPLLEGRAAPVADPGAVHAPAEVDRERLDAAGRLFPRLRADLAGRVEHRARHVVAAGHDPETVVEGPRPELDRHPAPGGDEDDLGPLEREHAHGLVERRVVADEDPDPAEVQVESLEGIAGGEPG